MFDSPQIVQNTDDLLVSQTPFDKRLSGQAVSGAGIGGSSKMSSNPNVSFLLLVICISVSFNVFL